MTTKMNRKELRQRLRNYLKLKGLRKKNNGGFGLQWEDKYKELKKKEKT